MTPSDPPVPFAWNAADYHKSSPAQHQWAKELIAKLGLEGNERVLDIGCGDGKITAGIARSLPGGTVTGVDNSPEMIRFANDHFPRSEYPNISFYQVDARALPFAEEFDVIFSNAALHWIPDHKPVLAGIVKSLRPNGKMLIQMGGKGNAEQILWMGDVVIKKPAWEQYFIGFSFTFGFFDNAEYREWLIESGFEQCRVELIPKDMTYASREDCAAWIRTTWLPWLARLPESKHSAFIEAIIDEYLKKYPADRNAMIHIPMVRLEAEARKRPPGTVRGSP
ncbi:MAG: methyltransferase domain-containing protein [Methanoregula sp.]|jgi:trans-aconitate methyltransferase|nr:methyltransferase domain-containing protein [Methanoregula sp.]